MPIQYGVTLFSVVELGSEHPIQLPDASSQFEKEIQTKNIVVFNISFYVFFLIDYVPIYEKRKLSQNEMDFALVDLSVLISNYFRIFINISLSFAQFSNFLFTQNFFPFFDLLLIHQSTFHTPTFYV